MRDMKQQMNGIKFDEENTNIRSIDSENNIEKYKEEHNNKIEKLFDTGDQES